MLTMKTYNTLIYMNAVMDSFVSLVPKCKGQPRLQMKLVTPIPDIGASRAVWVSGQDLATPHLIRNCRKRICHYTICYTYVCTHICYMLVTMCPCVWSSWYEYAWFKITWACRRLWSQILCTLWRIPVSLAKMQSEEESIQGPTSIF